MRISAQTRSRRASGFYLVECLISALISGILAAAIFALSSMMYRASATNQNQILASNMAQQVIDHARDQTFGDLLAEVAFSPQTLSDYTFPTKPAPSSGQSLFPRPLVCDMDPSQNMTYNALSLVRDGPSGGFQPTVVETLTNMAPTLNAVQVQVTITWKDAQGPHSYSASSTINQYGIHCY
jgi:type II secretory pathway pseudopilin PulG